MKEDKPDGWKGGEESNVPEAVYQGDGGFKYLNHSLKFTRNADVSDASSESDGDND